MEKSSSENFITEAFVHLLEYSIENNSVFFDEFLNLIKINFDDFDPEKVFIDTQRSFKTSFNNYAIPDITIQIKDIFIFIEVKFEASINQYTISHGTNETINQIEKYQAIKLSENVKKKLYTLVIYNSGIDFIKTCPDFIEEIFWHKVHSLIKKYKSNNKIEKFLHYEFQKFMEDNEMAIPKVTYELTKGMEAINNLFLQSEMVLNELNIPFNKSFGYNWTGYYLFKDSKKTERSFGFIGTYWNGTKLVFEFNDEKAVQTIKSKKLESDFKQDPKTANFFKEFIFEDEHYFCLKPDEQMDKLKNWIKNNYNLLKSLA